MALGERVDGWSAALDIVICRSGRGRRHSNSLGGEGMSTDTTAGASRAPESTKGVGKARRVAGVVVVLVGVVFLVTTFVNNLFEVGPAFEEMIDDFRPLLEEEAIATANGDLVMLAAAGEEFTTQIAPAMAQQLGMTPEEFGAFVQTNFPDVANGMAALPQITTTFSGLIDTLDSQRALFQSADEIPTKDLPATTVPWSILLAGILTIIVGLVMFFVPGRVGSILAVVLGALLVVVPLILNLPQKAADADELNDNLRPIYTEELVAGAEQALGTVAAMGTQMQNEMLPALAQQLGMSPDELNQFLGANFPATATALQSLPTALERFTVFTETFANNLDNYNTLKDVKFVPIIWTIIIGGVVVVLAGGVGIVMKD
jgi:ABC-type multidrug transport system fused ATPase/permease subunit